MQGTQTVIEWHGYKKGDKIVKRNSKEKFEFTSARLDEEGHCIWITVNYAKDSNHRGSRIIGPDTIVHPK
jgi:hypothetical protein